MDLNKIICVDFDKTIVDSDYPRIIGIKPGAREALQAFRDMGLWIIISSCRTCRCLPDIFVKDVYGAESQDHKDMVECLDLHQIPYDEIDDGTKGKIFATAYLDDKAIRFNDNWEEAVKTVKERL